MVETGLGRLLGVRGVSDDFLQCNENDIQLAPVGWESHLEDGHASDELEVRLDEARSGFRVARPVAVAIFQRGRKCLSSLESSHRHRSTGLATEHHSGGEGRRPPLRRFGDAAVEDGDSVGSKAEAKRQT